MIRSSLFIVVRHGHLPGHRPAHRPQHRQPAWSPRLRLRRTPHRHTQPDIGTLV